MRPTLVAVALFLFASPALCQVSETRLLIGLGERGQGSAVAVGVVQVIVQTRQGTVEDGVDRLGNHA